MSHSSQNPPKSAPSSGSPSLTATVDERTAGARLDAAIQRAFPGYSRKQARQIIVAGGLRVNGREARILSRTVKLGDVLTVAPHSAVAAPVAGARNSQTKASPPPRLQLLMEDPAFIVVNKPHGLLSERVPGENGQSVPDVLGRMGKGETFLVHRLDAGTSGAMLLARTEAMAAALSDQFREGNVEKSYLLIARGVAVEAEGRFDGPLGRDADHPRRFAVRPGGKASLTRYRSLRSNAGFSLFNARPDTGRTHQIRVHFTHAGLPLLGDKLYGAPRAVGALLVDRPLLHAWAMAFDHPRTGRRVRVVVPPAEDFTAALRHLDLLPDFDALDPLW